MCAWLACVHGWRSGAHWHTTTRVIMHGCVALPPRTVCMHGAIATRARTHACMRASQTTSRVSEAHRRRQRYRHRRCQSGHAGRLSGAHERSTHTHSWTKNSDSSSGHEDPYSPHHPSGKASVVADRCVPWAFVVHTLTAMNKAAAGTGTRAERGCRVPPVPVTIAAAFALCSSRVPHAGLGAGRASGSECFCLALPVKQGTFMAQSIIRIPGVIPRVDIQYYRHPSRWAVPGPQVHHGNTS